MLTDIKTFELTPEFLNLSASSFTSKISNWVPASFGIPHPSQTDTEFIRVLLNSTEGKERLGLGHPLLEAPTKLRQQTGYDSLRGLEKTLNKAKKKGKNHEESEVVNGPLGKKDDEENVSEEEESRASMIGKRKRNINLDKSIKKSKKIVDTSNTSSARTTPTPTKESDIVTSLPDGQKAVSIKATAMNDTQQTSTTQESPKKSKSARKREKKRLAKLAGQDI